MRCRHTVPDWHRYVVAGEQARPIFAACRLLLKGDERAADSRSIACGYWGRQPECPVYDGPAAAPESSAGAPGGDEPVGRERLWPVRPPGAPDGQRVALIALGVLSAVLLSGVIVASFAALSGRGVSSGFWVVILVAGGLSLVTHLLTILRLWVRR